MKKIALVNITPNCISPMMDCISEYTDIKPIQYLDSTILDEIRKEGRITDRCMGRMLSMIAKACVDGAEGIILTCTMFSKYVELFRKLFSVPIVGADVAMMEDAGESGGKTALLCTFEGTREVSTKLLEKYCKASGNPYTIDTYVLHEAYDEAQTGNMEKHNERIREKIRELDSQYDKIVLAQMSMAGAAKGLKMEHAALYTSPKSAIETIKKITSPKILGCIADDFTGASDAASFLAKKGIRTILLNGTPDEEKEIGEAQAIVIALKTRTMETAKAVEETLQAAAWLKEKNAQQIYIKYCSTFDSTREGNIGPIMDALLETYHVPYSVLCPSLPVNGRTVEDGKLYVNGVPLDESPMKNHPLTPMWDSDLANLMEAQSRYKCVKMGHFTEENQKQKADEIQEFQKEHDHFYVIPDYSNEKDAKNIVTAFGSLEILSGGSGLLEYLAEKYTGNNTAKMPETATDGKALLLAGSCSVATRNQIAYIQEKGIPSTKIDPIALMQNRQSEEELWNFIQENPSEVLVYSSDDPEAVKEVQKLGKDKAAALLEKTTADLAKRAVENGFTRIIVAGGETSGAVTKALGYDAYEIGESVAPGVPVMTPLKNRNIRLVLKSGNFGDVDFMEKALKMTGKDDDNE